MSRGPGRIERIIEETLRNTDRSYTVEELAIIAYPGINRAEKKHRVSVLRAITNVAKKILVWTFQTYTPPWRCIFTNGNNVRSFGHGLLRHSWWNAERTLEQIEMILDDPDIQSIMQPGGFWWTEVEIHKHKHECAKLAQSDGGCWCIKYNVDNPPETCRFSDEINMLSSYRTALAEHSLCALLGRFEPPGTPIFEYAMQHRTAWPEHSGTPLNANE